MQKSERIVRYTREKIDGTFARVEDRTDWVCLDLLSEAELEAAIASDPESETGPVEVDRIFPGIRPKNDGREIDFFARPRWLRVRLGR